MRWTHDLFYPSLIWPAWSFKLRPPIHAGRNFAARLCFVSVCPNLDCPYGGHRMSIYTAIFWFILGITRNVRLVHLPMRLSVW